MQEIEEKFFYLRTTILHLETTVLLSTAYAQVTLMTAPPTANTSDITGRLLGLAIMTSFATAECSTNRRRRMIKLRI